MAAPVSLVKRLRIFVSHPHVEWHETSSAMGEDAFREINETRRKRQIKAKNARERQRELQELRRVLEVRPGSSQAIANSLSTTRARLGAAQSQATEASNGHPHNGDAAQAFMSTLDAVPAIGSPLHVHTTGLDPNEAFASTAADSTLFDASQARALKPRHTRISGVSPLTPTNAVSQTPIAANDQTRASLPESIQAAAINLAVGDKASARTQLKAAFVQSPNKRIYAQAWLECLRACEEREAYQSAAAALSDLHDFVAPPYFSVAPSGPAMESHTPRRTGARHGALERFNVPSELSPYATDELLNFATRLQALRLQTAEQADTDEVVAVLSFVSLKSIAPDAALTLSKALALINDATMPFVLQGGTVLLDVLLEPFTAQQSLPSASIWTAALEACRLLGRSDKYEALSTAYSYLYASSSEHSSSISKLISDEYMWKPTKAQFRTFHRAVDDTADMAFSIESSTNTGKTGKSSNDDAMLPVYSSNAQPVSASDRAQSLRVTGQGTHDRVSRVLEMSESAAPGYTLIELDLSRSAYMHFDAAVALLNWAQRKREQGVTVVIREHGILIQALFEQISMADVAQLHPHYL